MAELGDSPCAYIRMMFMYMYVRVPCMCMCVIERISYSYCKSRLFDYISKVLPIINYC